MIDLTANTCSIHPFTLLRNNLDCFVRQFSNVLSINDVSAMRWKLAGS